MRLNDPSKDAERVNLGESRGSSDRDFYLYESGEVYYRESPNNGYSPARWHRLPEENWDSYKVEGKAIRQLVEENRAKLKQT